MPPRSWNRLNWSFPLVTLGGLGGLLIVLLWTRTEHPWRAFGFLLIASGCAGALGALLWWIRRRTRKTP